MNDNVNQTSNNGKDYYENAPDPEAELKRRKKNTRYVMSWISIVFVLGIILTTLIDLSQKWGCTEPVSAVVTEVFYRPADIEYRPGDDSYPRTISEGYDYVFEYTYNGVEYTHYTAHDYPKPSFKEGQKTELLINPDDPYSVYAPEEDYIRILRLQILVAWIAYIVIVILIMPEIKYRKKKL